MKNNINWDDYSNSEIEVKLKEIENEYKKTQEDITLLYDLLNKLNENYINGVRIINKRTNNFKYK